MLGSGTRLCLGVGTGGTGLGVGTGGTDLGVGTGEMDLGVGTGETYLGVGTGETAPGVEGLSRGDGRRICLGIGIGESGSWSRPLPTSLSSSPLLTESSADSGVASGTCIGTSRG